MGRYLTSGCAGFIASRVTQHLLAQGHTVVGVDNLNDAYDVRLKHWRLAQIQDRKGFSFHRLDICDRAALADLFDGQMRHGSSSPFDAIINLAARAGVRQSLSNPWVYVDTNATGTLNLLDLCRRYRVPKFILASTSSLYGNDNPAPFHEDMDTARPLSPYAASKKAAEAMCYTYYYLYGIDITIFRYFTVYGPAGRPDMSLFRFVQWISEGRPVTVYGDGQQSRDFTYVDDVARGTVLGIKELGYAVVNLGSDEPVPLCQAIFMLEQIIGKKAVIQYQPPQQADVKATWANISRANSLLGWEPRYNLQDGLCQLVEWYQQNRTWARDIVTAECA
jgi:UDP-glucuronate 4-epimerase